MKLLSVHFYHFMWLYNGELDMTGISEFSMFLQMFLNKSLGGKLAVNV